MWIRWLSNRYSVHISPYFSSITINYSKCILINIKTYGKGIIRCLTNNFGSDQINKKCLKNGILCKMVRNKINGQINWLCIQIYRESAAICSIVEVWDKVSATTIHFNCYSWEGTFKYLQIVYFSHNSIELFWYQLKYFNEWQHCIQLQQAATILTSLAPNCTSISTDLYVLFALLS